MVMRRPQAREHIRHILLAIILSMPGKARSLALHLRKLILASRARVNTIIYMQQHQMFWEWLPLRQLLGLDLPRGTVRLFILPVTPRLPDKTQQCRPVRPSPTSARRQVPAPINRDHHYLRSLL
jgi:hypothetical protein